MLQEEGLKSENVYTYIYIYILYINIYMYTCIHVNDLQSVTNI